MTRRGRRVSPLPPSHVLALALLLVASRGAAQGGAPSPLLAPSHWAVAAAARVEAMGLAPGYLPAQAAVPRSAVAAALRDAALRTAAPGRERPAGDAGSGMVGGWWRRFQSEFPEHAEEGEHPEEGAGPRALLGGSAGVGMERRRGAAAPGLDEFPPDRTGATPLPDRTRAVARAEVALRLGGWGAIYAAPVLATEESRVERGELVLGWRALRATIGRAEVGWGVGRGGGVILSGIVPLDRIGISTAAPVRLPGWLGLLGPFAVHAFAGPLPSERHPGSPWLAGGSASVKPHPRFTLSGHRALVLGGDHVDDPMGADEVVEALIGRNVPGVNQIASTSFRLRLPTERVIPLSVYCEWGAEDSAGAPFDAPGLVCGGASPSLPFAPTMTLGVEHAQLGARPVNGPPWYRHHMFPGNWAVDEATLGHPLGGEGRQWLVYSELTLLGGMLDVDAHAFRRKRTGENLYLPGREGESRGAGAAAAWRIHPRAELRLAGSREAGDGWAEAHLEIFSRILF